jgi:hypothetical protein
LSWWWSWPPPPPPPPLLTSHPEKNKMKWNYFVFERVPCFLLYLTNPRVIWTWLNAAPLFKKQTFFGFSGVNE